MDGFATSGTSHNWRIITLLVDDVVVVKYCASWQTNSSSGIVIILHACHGATWCGNDRNEINSLLLFFRLGVLFE